MNRRFIKFAPLAAEAFLSIYERISTKQNGKKKEMELLDLLADNVAELKVENQRLKKRVNTLRAFNVLALLFGVVALILHFV